MKKLTTGEFILKAKLAHGEKYDYSKTKYVNVRTKVGIVCHLHGIFQQFPKDHMNGHGCPICGFEKPRNKKWKGKNDSGLVEGIGFNDIPNMKSPAYLMWHNLLKRCYNSKVQERQPRYKGCSVCKEWLVFSNFKVWFENPKNGYRESYQLDKDILVKGNQIYSPETCCFIPRAINCIFGYHQNKSFKLPYGVYLHNGKFRAVLNHNGRNQYLGVFDTPEEAFNVYKQAKESYIKDIAKIYFERGEITQKVYCALMNYTIG